MLNMAKKNEKEKTMKTRKEKQIHIRINGTDLSSYQACGTNPKNVFRSGLYDESRNKKSAREIELKSQIFLVNNRMEDYKLKLMADELLLKKLLKELRHVKGFTENKRKQLIKSIKKEYFDFIEDEKYSNCDLTDFYEIRKDAISIYAMRVGIDYEHAVDVFDSYLEDEVAKQSALENTRIIEYE